MRKPNYHHWTCPDERFIEKYYLDMTDQEIAQRMNLTEKQVARHRINAMGLKKRNFSQKAA